MDAEALCKLLCLARILELLPVLSDTMIATVRRRQRVFFVARLRPARDVTAEIVHQHIAVFLAGGTIILAIFLCHFCKRSMYRLVSTQTNAMPNLLILFVCTPILCNENLRH